VYDTDVAHYNFNTHQPILVIFGRDVAERAYYQMVICDTVYYVVVDFNTYFFESKSVSVDFYCCIDFYFRFVYLPVTCIL